MVFMCITILMLSCNSQGPTANKLIDGGVTNAAHKDFSSVKKVLAKQLKRGSSMETSSAAYKTEDFVVVPIVASELLQKSGYKLPANFETRVKQIFGDKDFDLKGLNALNYRTGCVDKKDQFLLEETGTNKYYYIDFKRDLLTEFYPLPLLINYQKEFPDLAKSENNTGEVYDAVENIHKKNETWKYWPNLSSERQRYIHQITSRNKYLFNNSKADFAWLKSNDSVFLNRLVTVFGYVKDKDLIKWMLDKNLISSGNDEDFGAILWNQDCNGSINVHHEVFDLIKSETSDSDTRYLNSVANYIIYLRDRDKFLSLSNRAEVIAKVAYYAQKIVNKNVKQFEQDYYTRFLFCIIQTAQSKQLFEPEFKKHNYYNLPGFKELWDEQAEYNGGVAQPM